MKKFTFLVFATIIAIFASSGKLFSQVWTLDFEGTGGYTTSVTEFTDGGADYFLRTDGSNIASSVVYSSIQGSYYFGAQDTDGDGQPSYLTLTIDDISIATYTNLVFKILMAEDDASDAAEDWDADSYVHISYDIDNSGTFTDLIWVEAEGGTNTVPRIDTDFNGLGDGTILTPDFTEFSANIPGTGSVIDILIEFNALDAGDEDIAIDNLRIESIGGNSLPIISNVGTTPAADITSSDAVSVSADVTDSDGTITGVVLNWGTTSGSLVNTINMSLASGSTYTTDSDIPAQADGTTVYYEIVATDDEPESNTAGEFSYTVMDPILGTLPYSQGFDVDLDDMYAYSVVGDQVWGTVGFGNPPPSARMSGFASGAKDNEDWLITPSFDFTAYSNVYMTFEEAINYGAGLVDDNQQILVSTNYFGLGDPSAATWDVLTIPNRSAGNSWDFVKSGLIDLSAYSAATNVHIAFKYISTTAGAATWEVDNILIGETLNWYNLQWVSFSNMPSWYLADVYAQTYHPGVTDLPGQGAGIECWIGYSMVDENPAVSNNFTYISPAYFGDAGSNDEYKGNLGANIPMAPGTYYVVARWRFNGGPYHFGGYGGPWNGTSNVSAMLTIDAAAPASTWTGAVNDNWFDDANWTDGVPGYNTDATIPGGLTNYPSAFGTSLCSTLLLQSGPTGDASILGTSDLQVIGSTTVEKYITADTYHSFSPTVQGQTADIFHLPGSTGLDVYLYGHEEANNADPEAGYFEIVELTTPLVPGMGYAVYPDGANATPPVAGWTFMQNGVVNDGTFGTADALTSTGTGSFAGFNYVGNPYPSFIDWDAGSGWNKINLEGSIYIENNGNWALYPYSAGVGVNEGSNIIAPGQGFFVRVTDGSPTGTLMMTNDVRTNATTPYLKDAASNYVKLAATGNDRTDEMVVRFNENATAQFDGQFDGLKLAAGDYEYPQIYAIADKNLAYSALPETETVQLGFHCGVNGQYTISAIDINEIAEVWLEDTFTGIVTNLANASYTFGYTTNDAVNRFVLHFTALSTDEFNASVNNIYAYHNNVYIHMASNNGIAEVYNITGQLVNSVNLNSGTNQFRIDQTGNYIIKVVSDSAIATKKVNIQ